MSFKIDRRRVTEGLLRRLLSISIAAVGIILDQLTKVMAVEQLKGEGAKTLIPYILDLRYIENRGAAWGIFADRRWIFMTISSLTIAAILVIILLGKCRHLYMELPLAAILSGGIGNMIDRVGRGYVVDMLEFSFMDFPVFNVADCFVTVGTLALMIAMVYDIIKEELVNRRDAEYDALLEELMLRGEFDEEENEAFFENLWLEGYESEGGLAERDRLTRLEEEGVISPQALALTDHDRRIRRDTERSTITDGMLDEEEL